MLNQAWKIEQENSVQNLIAHCERADAVRSLGQ